MTKINNTRFKTQTLRSTTLGNRHKLPQQYNGEIRKIRRQLEGKGLDSKEIEVSSSNALSLTQCVKFGN